MKEEFLKINGLPVDNVKQSLQPFILQFFNICLRKMHIYEAYLICWLDEWLGAGGGEGPISRSDFFLTTSTV